MKHLRPLVSGLALLLAGAGACSSSQRHPTAHAGMRAPRGEIDGGMVSDLQRDLDESEMSGRGARAAREAVARYMASRGLEAAQSGDFEGAVNRLRQALVHYAPAELAQGGLPDELGPLALAVLEAASTRGDEAHALAAARVLLALRTPDRGARAVWDRVADWGTRNRAEFQRPWVAEGEQSEIFKEIARVIPAQDVLDAAAGHLVARRRAAIEGRTRVGRDGPRLNFDEAQQLQAGVRNSAADLAILFLRVGDVREAANRLTDLGTQSESSGLAAALGSIAQGEGGPDPLWDLAERLSQIDAAAAAGVCRVGRRGFPADPRFAQCLAVAAVREGDLALASAHLERASTLGVSDQRTLRAAIEAAQANLAREVGSDDLSAGRRAYERTRALLERWRAQYQGQLAPVTEADLETLAADMELSAGDLREAAGHLTRATQATPASRDAFYLLGEIAWRHRDGAEATRALRAGLALPVRPTESDSFFRPVYMVRLAQVAALSSDRAAARALFEEAATALDALIRSASDHELAEAHLRRAEAADALGDAARAGTSLRAAVDADPASRDVAARAITFALSRGRWADARDLYAVARAQLTLDRPWQAYFALWASAAARLGRLDDDGGARRALEGLASTAGDTAPWTVRLAQRYTGALDREQLARYVRTTGQRAESAFYEGVLKLAAGDAAGAEADLRAVVVTEVMRYFEYAMAWEMLDRHVTAAPAAPAIPAR